MTLETLGTTALAMLSLATLTWLLSLIKKDVSIVDSAWSLMFLLAATSIVWTQAESQRQWLVFALLAIWALRLSAHITIRSWGEAEDHRYQAIREKYSPGFALKSLFIIFVFQAVLAVIIFLPVASTLAQAAEPTALDWLAAAIVAGAIFFQGVADYQLQRFRNNPMNQGKVLNRGLWRYSRHPNYFAESVIWWGFYLFALNQGDYWTILGPLLITFLLLKFSGVSLLEQTISERRPAYRQYIECTNAFIPGPPKKALLSSKELEAK